MPERNDSENTPMSPDEFALLGEGDVAYIKQISGAEAAAKFGISSEIEADEKLYVLHGADGTCMAISDSLYGLQASAEENDLQTVSLH